jgi:hypothetical protein
VTIDTLGGITGTPNGKIVPNNPLLIGTGCTFQSAWNAYSCLSASEYVQFRIDSLKAPTTPTGTVCGVADLAMTGTAFTRVDDGATLTMSGSPLAPHSLAPNLISNRRYSIVVSAIDSMKCLSLMTGGKQGQVARPEFRVGPHPIAVTDVSTGLPVSEVTTLVALDSGNSDKFFYESGTQKSYVRLYHGIATPNWSRVDVLVRR